MRFSLHGCKWLAVAFLLTNGASVEAGQLYLKGGPDGSHIVKTPGRMTIYAKGKVITPVGSNKCGVASYSYPSKEIYPTVHLTVDVFGYEHINLSSDNSSFHSSIARFELKHNGNVIMSSEKPGVYKCWNGPIIDDHPSATFE